MHTVHFPDPAKQPEKPESIAAAMGIMFSVDNYNVDLTDDEVKTIDNFFDSLYLNQFSDPTVLAEYGGLMNLIDMKNRWVYKGSLTTPPCSIGVFFNILSNVYPMKQRHLDLFKKQLDRAPGYDMKKLSYYGNYREIQETTKAHNLHYISTFHSETDYSQDVDFWTGNGILLFTIMMQILTKLVIGIFSILAPDYTAFPYSGLNIVDYTDPETGKRELYSEDEVSSIYEEIRYFGWIEALYGLISFLINA